jgi:pimeloyl-ACP methyl ester carboxylesterase
MGWKKRLVALGAVGLVAQELAAWRYERSTKGPTRFLDEEERTAWTSPWSELLVPLQWLRLRASPEYGGAVPHGNGAPVLLVHGFLTRGRYLAPLRDWLQRIGYRAEVADIGLNADCTDILTDRLVTIVERTRDTTGAPAHLIGHSFGGVLVRATAARARNAVASVTTLAAPIRGLAANPGLRLAAAAVRATVHARRGNRVNERCLTFACECVSVRALHTHLPADLPQLAIVARRDGVADWRYGVGVGTPTVEVTASHMGVVVNPAAYRAIATHLAAASHTAARARGA